jgi:cyclopropane-fatty-acyl-phospholipid synthase
MSGFWSADDLTAVIRIFALHPELFSGMDKGLARIISPLHKYIHALKKNTREGSRRNIVAHYDLGNDFYRLFLDDTMTYSCGIFERPDSSLKDASISKYDRICRKLGLSAADQVLEIGTGWGGFAIHAAKHYGCRVTTTTISRRQRELAVERVERAGLASRVQVLHSDYRELTGRFDKLVSVEMLEAVGHRYYPAFFAKCASLLHAHGLLALQVITIPDQRYAQHLRGVDFIKRHVFPGSNIPSVTALLHAAAGSSDLRLRHLEDIGPHYARTLAAWRENLARHGAEVEAITEPRFRRLWHFYLCYCEAAFAEGYIGDAQMLLSRPRAGW